jgi:hypothetical protein
LQKTKRRDVLKIAICLMQAYFFTKCTTIKLTNVVLRPWNVDKRSKQEALEEMEEAGMIQVERLGKCRAPIVHILNTEELPNVRF